MIKKAANYFERQRYRLAYDEVSGVEVKEKDQDLKDRIYTVMYVERLYESYENNMKLGRADKASMRCSVVFRNMMSITMRR